VRKQTGTIRSLAFSPDSKRIAAASEDGTVCVFDTASGALVHTLNTGKGAATSCCFDPAGARLFVGRQDWAIRVYDSASGELTSTLRQKRAAVESISFTADGSRFAIGTTRGSLQVWDGRSCEQLLVLQEVGDAFHCVAFDPRGTRLIACGDEHAVRVYETRADVARGVQRAGLEALPSDDAAADMKPMEIEAQCRRVVQHAGLDPALYERAESLARGAFERLKESGQIQTTLGAAIYRRDRSEDALEELVKAGDLRRGWPPNLAFRTMALAKLGRIDEARGWMQKLDTLLLEERWKSDADSRALAEEAHAVLAGAKPAPKSAPK
jgi:tetratricopeptide (TPR) repeat protein